MIRVRKTIGKPTKVLAVVETSYHKAKRDLRTIVQTGFTPALICERFLDLHSVAFEGDNDFTRSIGILFTFGVGCAR